MSAEMMSSKIQNTTKEIEEKKASERKKNLLYLIANYLKENGFINTSDIFMTEAQLSDTIDVCDNIDLDIILQEFMNYYFIKFKKYPKITKKLTVGSEIQMNKTTENKTNQALSKTSTKSINTKKGEKQSEKKEILSLTVKPLLQQNDNGESDTLGNQNQHFDEHGFRPLYNFTGFNSEWKELADIITRDVIYKDLQVKWEDIKGLDDAKSLLKEAVLYPLKYPKLFSKIPVPWKGILMYGPPGTGKTFLAKALASQCQKSTFFNMSASSLISKWRGESEKLVRVLFELAKYQQPSTIFIDEIDALGSKRDENQHEASRRFKSELLVQMDGLNSSSEHVFLLATSNLPWEIDTAILRRFEKRILIDFPSFAARCEIFKHYLNELSQTSGINSDDYENFAKLTVGYTGSDIKMICKEASITPIRREISKNKNDAFDISNSILRPINVDDVLTAIQSTKPSTKYLNEKYQKWHKEFGCD